jgi:hypothetical protein
VITVRSIGSLPTARLSALPTLLLTIKRHLHILRHAKHHWQIPLRAEKSPRCDRTAMIRGFSRPGGRSRLGGARISRFVLRRRNAEPDQEPYGK